jgi:hypothetical protein
MKAFAIGLAMVTEFLLCTSAFAEDAKVESPDFTIEVVLSEQARLYLLGHSETVRVNISFADIIGPGWHYLGGVKQDIAPEKLTSLSIRDVAFNQKEIAALKSPNYEVLVNVYSARRSLDNNVLDCDLLQGYIADLQRKVHTLRCELGKGAPR